MEYVAMISHYYPSVSWRLLTYRQFFGYINRIAKILAVSKNAEYGESEAVQEMDYLRKGI